MGGNLPFVPGVYQGNSSIAELILRAGQERARGQERLGQTISDAVLNIGGAAQQGFAQKRQMDQAKQVQGAVSAGMTHPDDFEQIVSQIKDPQAAAEARKAFNASQEAASRIAERHAQMAEQQAKTEAAKRALVQQNTDDAGTIFYHLKDQASKSADGGIQAAKLALGLLIAKKVPGAERFQEPLAQLDTAFQQAAATGDPAKVQEIKAQALQSITGLADAGLQDVSPEHLQRLQPKMIPIGPKGLLNTATGQVIGASPEKETRTVDEQLAAAQLAGDQKTVATLLDVKRKAALASHVTDPSQKLVKVEHKDPTTGRTVIEWLPQSEVKGKTFEKGDSGTIQARLASAEAVNQTGTDIITKLKDPAYAGVVGPAMGRLGKVRDWLGDPPPELAELAGLIESYSLANMGVHGMRSVQGSEKINKLLDAHHTPESLIAAINGLQGFSTHFMQNEGRAGQGSPRSGPKRLTFNPATGNLE